MGIRNIPFAVSGDAIEAFREEIKSRCDSVYNEWKIEYDNLMNSDLEELKEKYKHMFIEKKNIDLTTLIEPFYEDMNDSMRNVNGDVMNVIADNIDDFIGGSADLSSSTKTNLNKYKAFSSENYDGRNIYFGVREHSMGAILNGIALSGIRTFGSTFLVFSDYIKPAIRLSALMDLPVTYVFTHDSILIGQDGPTHQPIEQLVMLRSIPNFKVYRPADANEIVGCWNNILKENKPCAIVISRNESKLLKTSKADMVSRGAYIVRKEVDRLSGIIIATGAEVSIALEVASKLYEKGIDIRVISMPCANIFEKQTNEYKDSLIPIGYKTIVMELSSSYSWYDYVYNSKYLITLNEFGKSGTKEELLIDNKLDIKSITERVEKILR
jgi:transketolase